MSIEDKRQQVADQCKVVAHLAHALADLHSDKLKVVGALDDGVLNIVGAYTAAFMEKLGDMLNGIDAVSDEDEWTHPIFEKAQGCWPTRAPEQEGRAEGLPEGASSPRSTSSPSPTPVQEGGREEVRPSEVELQMARHVIANHSNQTATEIALARAVIASSSSVPRVRGDE